MKPSTTWLARLGIAGACLLVTGCGGSDIPDASNDGQAAAGGAPVARAAEAPAAAPVEGPKVAQADEAPKAEEVAPAEPTSPSPAPEPETPANSPKPEEGKGNSSTAEMLAMATGPAGGGSTSSAGGSAPSTGGSTAPAPNTPGGPGGPGAMMAPAAPGGGMMPGGRRGGPERMPGMAPPGTPGGSGARGEMPGAGVGPGMRGGPGMPGGGPGGTGRDNTAPNYHNPEGAINAFLNALKAKDLDRLNESTALRAQVESSSKNQDLFKKIFDLSLSDAEIDELAGKLEGYRIYTENPPKSTGRVDVILSKTGAKNAYFLRKITVRHEKKGWGVLDIDGEQKMSALPMIPNRRGGMGGRRR